MLFVTMALLAASVVAQADLSSIRNVPFVYARSVVMNASLTPLLDGLLRAERTGCASLDISRI
jgi:hypothetical protein